MVMNLKANELSGLPEIRQLIFRLHSIYINLNSVTSDDALLRTHPHCGNKGILFFCLS